MNDCPGLTNGTYKDRETLMSNLERRKKQTREWGISTGVGWKEGKTVGKRILSEIPLDQKVFILLSSWDRGAISLYFFSFKMVKMSWRNSQGLCLEDT